MLAVKCTPEAGLTGVGAEAGTEFTSNIVIGMMADGAESD
jgi:hypothetical protein